MDASVRLAAALGGRYVIESQAGVGGMATVYVARDLRHDRKVALKVLHPDLAAALGAERFLAEIKTTANLHHPHILPLHDSGEAEGFLYYVMPYVPGETLRARLTREQLLPIDEALRIATEVLSALDYAHRSGVVHRDIKPENILLHDGSAMVADFGIALAVTAAGGQRMTQTGLSLGTPQYMSPEQATGDKHIDGRADVYAAGAVLYEMLTGEAPFTGASVQAIVAKVLTERPTPPTTVRDTIPLHIEGSVLKALAKLPADRFASAAAFARALTDASQGLVSAGYQRTPAGGSRKLWIILGVAAAALVLATVLTLNARAGGGDTSWTGRLLGDSRPSRIERFDISELNVQRPAPAVTMLSYYGRTLAIARDGSRIAYVGADSAGPSRLWVREMDELEPRPVPGTEGATSVTLSPDGQALAFVVASSLRTVSLRGGSSTTLVPSNVSAPDWAADGFIYYTASGLRGAVSRVAAAGGASPELVISRTENGTMLDVLVLPDGNGGGIVAYHTARASIVAFKPGDTTVHELGNRGGRYARYAHPGHLVYERDGRLMALRFDARRLATTGPPIPVAEAPSGSGQVLQFDVSANGTLVYMVGNVGDKELVWVARNGARQPVDSSLRGNLNFPALSPDGRRLAFEQGRDIWIAELRGGGGPGVRGPGGVEGSPTRLTTERASRWDYPAWTSDGASVSYFRGDTSGGYSLWRKRADGSAVASQLPLSGLLPTESHWSADGKWLVFRTTATTGSGSGDLYAVRAAMDSTPMPLLATPAAEMQPALSPDGRFLAYASDESGRYEVHVVPFPNTSSARWVLSTRGGGGAEPVWSRRGDELFYRDASGNMIAVSVQTVPTFAAGTSRVLFPAAEYAAHPGHRQFDVTADGRRFVMVLPLSTGRGRVVLVKNWLAGLQGAQK
ncbi:MAG: protein kinase [Gemmatimonadaceae bacterium]